MKYTAILLFFFWISAALLEALIGNRFLVVLSLLFALTMLFVTFDQEPIP
jgi:hypothetical protein